MKTALLLAAFLVAACSPIQTVSYAVHEPDGRTTQVDKYFASLVTDDPGDKAFKQIQAGRVDEALTTIQEAIKITPTDASYRYDLAILWEIKGDWSAALAAIREARRLAASNASYGEEEAFIVQHGGK